MRRGFDLHETKLLYGMQRILTMSENVNFALFKAVANAYEKNIDIVRALSFQKWNDACKKVLLSKQKGSKRLRKIESYANSSMIKFEGVCCVW